MSGKLNCVPFSVKNNLTPSNVNSESIYWHKPRDGPDGHGQTMSVAKHSRAEEEKGKKEEKVF